MKTGRLLVATLISLGMLGSVSSIQAAEPTTQTQAQEKPTVYFLATGGTIAGSAASDTQMTGLQGRGTWYSDIA